MVQLYTYVWYEVIYHTYAHQHKYTCNIPLQFAAFIIKRIINEGIHYFTKQTDHANVLRLS